MDQLKNLVPAPPRPLHYVLGVQHSSPFVPRPFPYDASGNTTGHRADRHSPRGVLEPSGHRKLRKASELAFQP